MASGKQLDSKEFLKKKVQTIDNRWRCFIFFISPISNVLLVLTMYILYEMIFFYAISDNFLSF